MIRKALDFLCKGPVLLAILVIAGMVVWWQRPAWALENGRLYNVEKKDFRQGDAYTVLGIEQSVLCIIQYNPAIQEIASVLVDMQSSGLQENYSYGPSVCPGLVQRANDNYWFLLRTFEGRYHLVRLLDENHKLTTDRKEIFEYPKADSLLDFHHHLHGFVFGLADRMVHDVDEPFIITQTGDSLNIALSNDTAVNFARRPPEISRQSRMIEELANDLSGMINKKVSVVEAWQIVQRMRMLRWLYKRQKNRPEYIPATADIFNVNDLNGDGSEELLIGVRSTRFITGYMMAYDIKRDSLLWTFGLSGYSNDVILQDIDGDNVAEIIFNKYAPGQEVSPWWYEVEDLGSTSISEIIVLDRQGKQKTINGHKCRYQVGRFGSMPVFQPLDCGRILFGVHEAHLPHKNKLKVIDTRSGRIDTLDLAIGNPLAMNRTDEGISVYHCDTNYIYRHILDNELNPKHQYKYPTSYSYRWEQSYIFDHEGEQCFVTSPLSVFDSRMNPIILDPDSHIRFPLYHDGALYYARLESTPGVYRIQRLNFEPNTAPNMYAVIIWLAAIALIAVYWLTRSLVSLPFEVVEGNYAVLYEVLSLFFVWKIIGFQSVYSKKHGATIRRRHFSELLKDLADEQKNLFTRNLGIIRIHYFKLQVDNEMHIVQRIAHDIKNQLHHINIQVAEEAENDRLGQVSSTIDDIYQKTSMLSDFSRINLLKRQPIDLINILDEIIFGYAAHPRSADIMLDTDIESVIINADNDLIRIALRNLIENAMKYSPEDTPVNIGLNIDGQQLALKIANIISEKSGFTQNHPKSSGIGLDISRRIIQSHEGIMETDFTAPEATITITLPITEDTHGR